MDHLDSFRTMCHACYSIGSDFIIDLRFTLTLGISVETPQHVPRELY